VIHLLDQAKSDLIRINQGDTGKIRIALECHSCFEWLIPCVDEFQNKWSNIEMDFVAGFHANPILLLRNNLADLVILSSTKPRAGAKYHTLFSYEILAMMAHAHPHAKKAYLTARDFERETLAHYPVVDHQIEVVREVLQPANIDPPRKPAELTVGILRLVASQRAIAALPRWAAQPSLDQNRITARPIRKKGLFANLYAATTLDNANTPYLLDFIKTLRRVSFETMEGIRELK
jgi:LysR family transcriptional regulator, regulator for metE and metH